jgi:hypothetical protein
MGNQNKAEQEDDMKARAAPEPVSVPWVVSVTMCGPADDDIEVVAGAVRDTYGMRSSNVSAVDGLLAAEFRIDALSASAAIVLVDDLLLDVVGGAWTPVTILVEPEGDRARTRALAAHSWATR